MEFFETQVLEKIIKVESFENFLLRRGQRRGRGGDIFRNEEESKILKELKWNQVDSFPNSPRINVDLPTLKTLYISSPTMIYFPW